MSKLGDNAATNSTVATLVGAVEALRQDVLNQATTITGLSSTIVRLENTVEEQDRTIAMLQANAVRQETAIEGQVEGLDGIRATLQTNATSQAAGIAQLADADVMHADAIAALQANTTSHAADIAAVYEAAIAELRSDFLNLIERLAVAEETVAVADGRVDRLNETAVRSTQFGSRSQWPDSLTVRGAGQAGYPNDFFPRRSDHPCIGHRLFQQPPERERRSQSPRDWHAGARPVRLAGIRGGGACWLQRKAGHTRRVLSAVSQDTAHFRKTF